MVPVTTTLAQSLALFPRLLRDCMTVCWWCSGAIEAFHDPELEKKRVAELGAAAAMALWHEELHHQCHMLSIINFIITNIYIFIFFL